MLRKLRRLPIVLQSRLRELPYRRAQYLPALDRAAVLKDPDATVYPFGSAETITVRPTLRVSDEVPTMLTAHDDLTRTLDQPYVAEFSDVTLRGQFAFPIHNRRRLEEAVLLSQYTAWQWAPINYVPDRPPLDLDCATLLTSSGSHNMYFVWMVHSAMRLRGIQHYIKQTGRRPKLIIPANAARFVTESLKMLGYTEDDWVEWRTTKGRVKRFVMPTNARQGAFFSPETCRWLRDAMIKGAGEPDAGLPKRIYISRAKARRRVLNEDKVLKLLEPLGFVSYCLEDLPLADQVKLFYGAEAVVGPHGAGLTNILFGHGMTVIECLGSTRVTNSFMAIAASCGHRYGATYDETDSPHFAINVAQLQAVMERAGLM